MSLDVRRRNERLKGRKRDRHIMSLDGRPCFQNAQDLVSEVMIIGVIDWCSREAVDIRMLRALHITDLEIEFAQFQCPPSQPRRIRHHYLQCMQRAVIRHDHGVLANQVIAKLADTVDYR